MKAQKFSWNRSRGTTLLFALVILAVGAMVLAGLVAVSGAMVQHTVAAESAMTRRLTLENSRTLAVQYVREKLLKDGAIAGVTQASVTSGSYALGGVTIGATGTSPWQSTTAPAGPNPFSPAGDTRTTISGSTYYYSGYTQTLAGTLSTGATTVPWSIEVRTRTPTLGYDLATFYSGTPTGINSANSIAYDTGPRLSGILLNSAFPPNLTPSGTTTSGATHPFNYVNSATAGATFVTVAATGTVSQPDYLVTNGTLNVYLNSTANTAKTLVVSGSLRELNFTHNSSPSYNYYPGYPLRVICSGVVTSSTFSLTTATTRQIYLVYNSGQPAVTIKHANTPKFTAVLMSATATIDSGTIQGGVIRSGAGGSLSVSGGGTLSILRETTPGTLDQMAFRRGWVETYRND